MTGDAEVTATEVYAEREPPLKQVADQVSHLWWVPLVAGVVSIGLGLAIMANDWTAKALVVVTGIFIIFRGVALMFNPTHAADSRGEQVVAGVAGIVVGVILVAWPQPTLLVLAFAVGAWLAVSGTFHVVTSVTRRDTRRHWFLGLAFGAVELLLGIWAMRRPEVTLSLLITLIGLWTVITGVIYCVEAFELRSAAKEIKRAEQPRTITLPEQKSATVTEEPLATRQAAPK
jgi:uncharacterized membrane protein HdeD (DUF308 family)